MSRTFDALDDRSLRTREMLARHLGGAGMRAFADPDVTEIYVNPDGFLRFDTRSRGPVASGERLAPDHVLRFLNTVASSLSLTLDDSHPLLQAELPLADFGGARLQGIVPPLASAPSFVIRKPPTRIYSLDEYVESGVLAAAHREVLGAAVLDRANVLVAGGTGSGKTTFANALLQEIAVRFPEHRIVVLEDTVELQCPAADTLALRTASGLSLADLVKVSLRTKPDRIVIGEVRDAAALDLLDAWATGHPGGVATLHATDSLGALHRLDRLAQRANVPPQRQLVADAIDLVALLEGNHGRRRVRELVRVRGLDRNGQFEIEPL